MGKELRIVHVVQCAGGVARYLQLLLKYADKTLFEHILICSLDYKVYNFDNLVSEILYIDMRREMSFSDIRTAKKIRKVLKSLEPDLVYCHSSKGGGYGRLACIGMDIPVIYNPHGWAFNMQDCSPMKKNIFRWIERLLAFQTDVIVTISEWERWCAIHGRICKKNKLKLVKSGIDVEGILKQRLSSVLSRKDCNIPEDAFVIGSVARITIGKGYDLFVTVAAEIKRMMPNAFFVWVGDGESREEFETMIAERGLKESFLITGWIDNTYDYIHLFDVATLFSRWEGFGLVVTEYMLSRKPLVAFAVGGVSYLVDNGRNGKLIELDEAKNPSNIAKVIMELASDSKMMKFYVNNAYDDVVKFYDAKRMCKETDDLFLNIINKRGGVKSNLLIICWLAPPEERRVAA